MSDSMMVRGSVQHKMFPCTKSGLVRFCADVCDVRCKDAGADASLVHNFFPLLGFVWVFHSIAGELDRTAHFFRVLIDV